MVGIVYKIDSSDGSFQLWADYQGSRDRPTLSNLDRFFSQIVQTSLHHQPKTIGVENWGAATDSFVLVLLNLHQRFLAVAQFAVIQLSR
jgi:hypothetical protein